MHTTWFMSVDWLMTVFAAPILTVLLWKYGKKIFILILGLLGCSALHTFCVAYDNYFLVQELDL